MAPQPLRQPRKLKDSCSSCSLSKVRCTKEKPTCARCARRNLPCGYGVSRRTGRHPCPPSPADSCESPSAPAAASGSVPDHGTSPGSITYRPGPGPGQGSDAAPSPDRHARQGSEASRLVGTGSGEDGASSSSGSPPQGVRLSAAARGHGADGQAGRDPEAATPHSATTTVAPHPHTPFASHAGGGLSPSALGDDLGADIWGAFDAQFRDVPSPPWMMDAFLDGPTFVLAAEAAAPPAPPAAESCCLGLLLQTLAQLFPTPPAGCQLAGGLQTTTTTTTTTRSLGRVIADNKQTIAKISRVLSCAHCAADGYILSVATMALYKTMSWYMVAAHGGCGSSVAAAAAAPQPSSLTEAPRACPFPAVAPLGPFAPGLERHGGEPEDDEQEPASVGAARQVVSELHEVASLVQSLSQCLQNLRERAGTKGRAGRGHEGGVAAAVDPALLAAPLAEGLEHDLRQRFRSVSANVLGILRQA